ncbi:hypothetical protein CR513_00597, partial [Mucuna pruriens]
MITNCGEYPNAPLLGTQGAINYNPELTSQQAKEHKPTEENTIEKSDAPGPTSSEKGQHGEPGAMGPPQSTGPGLSNESTSGPGVYEIQETLKIEALEGTLEQMKTERGMLKRKMETTLEEARQERRLSNEFSKKARAEKESRLKISRCIKAADQEMCNRRAEPVEKEQLEETVAALRSKEAKRENKVRRLRERVVLLEEELKAARLSKEHLQNQRRSNLLALVEARGKTDEAES